MAVGRNDAVVRQILKLHPALEDRDCFLRVLEATRGVDNEPIDRGWSGCSCALHLDAFKATASTRVIVTLLDGTQKLHDGVEVRQLRKLIDNRHRSRRPVR